jgi:hypothetical protein
VALRIATLAAMLGLVVFATVTRIAGAGQVPASETTAVPRSLHGAPLSRLTGLRLLVADNPPYLLNVDTGQVTPVLDVSGHPVLSVLQVGKDAVIWLDRRYLRAEIYVVRRGTTKAVRLATAWSVAPAADGRAVWLKSYTDARHCTLREVGLDGRPRRRPRAVPCSTRLQDSRSGTVLMQGSSVVDPASGKTLLRTGGVWVIAGLFALTTTEPYRPLTVTDLRSSKRWRVPWPSRISGVDQAVVHAGSGLIAMDFAEPAYQGTGTQVADVWLLDPATRRLSQLPGMPAAVSLKFTSMSWTSDGRLVLLARSARRDVVAVWRPGWKHIAVRTVRLPIRGRSGSDTFAILENVRLR